MKIVKFLLDWYLIARGHYLTKTICLYYPLKEAAVDGVNLKNDDWNSVIWNFRILKVR